jgi:DNA gyrase/topoisomerase IV subunit A
MSDENKKLKLLWPEMSDVEFNTNDKISDIDISEYNLEKMKVFSFNINTFRQILRLSDSLKPVERRILYSMYLANCRPTGKPFKSGPIVANTMFWHSHGDLSIYASLVGLTSPWKRSVPLVDGCGTNFGNDAYPEKYAPPRYTEARISKYAWECFFEDYDDECVEKVFNSSYDKDEPMSLPSKFPNILVNGGLGIAIGNSFGIPPYNVNDIIDVCKRLIADPNHSDIYMIPDLPTNCDVVDDGRILKEICETGRGTLKMRATIDVYEGVFNKKPVWILEVKNIPWLVSLTSIEERIVELTRKNILPIKDTQNSSYQVIVDKENTVRMKISYKIIIDKSHDPHKIKNKLFTMTDLQKTIPVNFNVVMDDLTIKRLNMRELVLSWLDERRAYKRRLLNKKITKLMARASLLEILIRLLDKDNIEKTMTIIKNSNHDEIIDRLKEHGNMSSFQATKIADMKLSAFTKDATEKYNAELIKIKAELENTMTLIKSEKKIDKVILSELDDLKKYATPRKSRIIEPETGAQISNTEHSLIVTNQGLVKKLPVPYIVLLKRLNYS